MLREPGGLSVIVFPVKSQQLIKQSNEPVEIFPAAEPVHDTYFVLMPQGGHLLDENHAFRCKMQRMRATVVLFLTPLGQPTAFDAIHQENEICPLDAELLCDCRLLLPWISGDHRQNGELGRSEFELRKAFREILKGKQLGPTQFKIEQ